jgi:hypothetical protein
VTLDRSLKSKRDISTLSHYKLENMNAKALLKLPSQKIPFLRYSLSKSIEMVSATSLLGLPRTV